MGIFKQQNLSSQVNGVNLTFVLSEEYETGTAQLLLNNTMLRKDVDYAEQVTPHSFLLVTAPTPGQTLIVYYFTKFDAAVTGSGLTTAVLKDGYLFGLNLKDRMGNPITTQTLQSKIDIAIAYFQRDLDIFITPKIIKSTAVLGYGVVIPPEPGVVYDLLEDPYDYNVQDYLSWGFLRLRKKPVISVERIRLIYPTGQEIISYPPEWIKLYHKFGQVNIVPLAGSFKNYPLIGQGSMYLPLLSGFLTKSIPSLIHADYTVGFKQGEIPVDFLDIIYKKSAIEILRIAGGAAFPGVASVSTGADGLSESTTLSQSGSSQLYQSYINAYQKDIDDYLSDFRETQKGITFDVM